MFFGRKRSKKNGWIRKFLARFPFSSKLIFSFCLFIVSIFLCIYLLIITSSETRRGFFAELEGNRYQQNIRKTLEQVLKHQIASFKLLSGDESAKRSVLDLQSRISEELNALRMATEENEGPLKLSQQAFQVREIDYAYPPQIEKGWEEYSNEMMKQTAELSNTYQVATIHSILQLLEHVGNSSTLFFDNEPETRYLVNAIFDYLPDIEINIAKLAVSSQEVANAKTVTLEQRNQIEALVVLIRAEAEKIQNTINKVIIEQKNSGKAANIVNNLSNPSSAFSEAINALLESTNQLIISLGKHIATPQKELFSKSYDLSEFNIQIMKTLSRTNQLWETAAQQIERLLSFRLKSYYRTQGILIVSSICLFILGLLIATVTLAQLRSFVSDVTQNVVKFKQGDLKARAREVADKELEILRQQLNMIGDTILEMVNQLQASGIELTASTTQIASAAKNQEGTVFQQEATVKEILVTADEISKTAQEFAKTMNAVSLNAEETSTMAASGKEGLLRMEETMRQMVQASTNIASKLSVLNEKASAITSVITTITKVADQTNLLSLNAAIEAEKAGEHGKSFSVIAKEIRRLADQVANATLDIEKMVSEMMSSVSEGVMGVDTFSEEIRTGVRQVSEVSNLLSKIISGVQLQTSSFESVNKRMQALALGADQINEAIRQLSDATQETTSSIRQFHTAIQSLTKSTKQMQLSVATVKKPHN